jgi:hypothetical protein
MDFISRHLGTPEPVTEDQNAALTSNRALGVSSLRDPHSNKATVKKSREKVIDMDNYFMQDILQATSSGSTRVHTSLTNIVEIQQLLGLLTSVCCREINWENRNSLAVVENILAVLVQQQFIYKYTELC